MFFSLSLLPDIAGRPLSPSLAQPQGGNWLVGGGKSKRLPPDNDNDENSTVVKGSLIQGGFFNWPPPPHARLNRALVHGLAVHEEEGAS